MIKKSRIDVVSEKIDALDLELSKLNVNDPKVSQSIKSKKAELISLHSEQNAAVSKKIDELELELSKLDVNGPVISNRIKDIKAELVRLHTEQDAE
jgi:chaperonin cofactor prefoldin